MLGLVVMTLGVLGLFRMPDVYLQLHASSKAVVLGVVARAGGPAVPSGGAARARRARHTAPRRGTSPAGTHAIARSAFRRERERR